MSYKLRFVDEADKAIAKYIKSNKAAYQKLIRLIRTSFSIYVTALFKNRFPQYVEIQNAVVDRYFRSCVRSCLFRSCALLAALRNVFSRSRHCEA